MARNSNQRAETPASAVDPGEALDPGTALAPYLTQNRAEQEARVRRDFWTVLRRAGRSLPFAEDAVAAFYCATDTRTPLSARATLFAALAYFVAPFDLVPDILMLIGFGDDMAVLLAVIAVLKTNITPDHYAKARDALADKVSDA
ncbi:MAG: YkvA family protein [Rhizobiaceae bacterium]|nr:YkvA family protein [Rhizobiaceae bacterium]